MLRLLPTLALVTLIAAPLHAQSDYLSRLIAALLA